MKSPKGIFKNIAASLLGVTGVLILFATAMLSGLPTLLHHLTSEKGVMQLTTIDKKLRGSRYQCSPALVVEEFTWYGADRICIKSREYNQFNVGDKLTATGLVSSFGIEVISIKKSKN